LRAGEWRWRQEDIRDLVTAGAALAELHGRHDAMLLPDAWEQDLAETRLALNDSGRRWWRFVSGAYRRARARLVTLCRAAPPEPLDERLVLIDAVLTARRHREELRRHECLAARLFGPR